MNKKYFPLSLLLFISLFFCNASVVAQKKALSKTQCDQDLLFLKEVLSEIHPSVPRYTTVEAISDHIDSLTLSFSDSLTSWAFHKKVRSVLSLVGCIHTNASSPKVKKRILKKRKPLPRLPVSFYTDGKRIFIDHIMVDSLDSLLGAEVLEIEGKSASELLSALYKYRSGDGQINPFMNGLLNSRDNFRVLLEAYFDYDSVVQMTLIPKDKKKQKYMIYRDVLKPKKPKKKKPEKWTFNIINHFYRADSAKTYGYLKIPSFYAKAGWRKFYKNVISDLNENKIDHFIVDLRNCPGGNIIETQVLLSMILDTTMYYTMQKQRKPIGKHINGQSKLFVMADWMKWSLFSTAKKYKKGNWKYIEQKKKSNTKLNYDGNMYVFTDEISSSSATVVASYLKEKADAYVIGRETGGGAAGNSGLYYPKAKLPNSKILVRVPQYWLDYHLIEDKGRGVIPNLKVEYTIDDVLEKKDLEMEAFLKILKEKTKT